MRIIEAGDRRASDITKRKIRPEKLYRLSAFTFAYSEDRKHLLRNTLTGMTAALSDSEWSRLQQLRTQQISGEELCAAGLEGLARCGFFLEEGVEEAQLYEVTLSVLKSLSQEKPGTKSYTILPTTGCNARCPYCFEQGMLIRTMSAETADRTADFICRTRWQDKIELVWFGGEPLVGSGVISRICRRLQEKGVSYRSKIVTNATMFTPKLLEEAVALWRLEAAQVTVDGQREDYEARKRFVNPAAYNYDTLMRAVGGLLEKGIRVSIRCNYDGGNQDGLKELFRDLKERFGSPENLSVYLAMLFQVRDEDGSLELFRKTQELNACLREMGLKKKKDDSEYKLKLHFCMADAGDKSVVIDPDGMLYHCEGLPGNEPFGSVFDENPVICSDPRAALPPDERCRSCCFLPECTPFMRNGCSDYFENCRAFKEIETEAAMRLLAAQIDSGKVPAETEKNG